MTSTSSPIRPLDGVRVLDLTSNVSGPFATMILARMGADVIKIERPPRGDDARSFPPFVDERSLIFESCNIGKRSVLLDLRRPDALKAFFELATDAQVVIHSFKPGVAERLGIAEHDVRARNDDVLYCDISAFGDGPMGSLMKGFDPIVQAFSGIMDMTGYPDSPPARCAPSIIDIGNGQWMAIGVLAALLARRAGSPVHAVSSALVDSAVALIPWQASEGLIANRRPIRQGTSHGLGAPYSLFDTADSPLFISATNPALWQALCEAIERPDLLSDQRFADGRLRIENRNELIEELNRHLRTRSADTWMPRLLGAGVPCSTVYGVNEAVRHPIAAERGWFEDIGGHPVVRSPFLLDGAAVSNPRPAPELGEHSVEVLGTIGVGAEEAQVLAGTGSDH